MNIKKCDHMTEVKLQGVQDMRLRYTKRNLRERK